jgi:hypothetical protein
MGPPKSRRCRVRPDRYLSSTHSRSLHASFSTVKATHLEEGARAAHPLVISFIRPTRNGTVTTPTQTTGDPPSRALLDDALRRPRPTIDAREGGHAQSIVSVPPPIPAPNDGGRRLVGAVRTTLTAALLLNREVPVGVLAPLAATALPAPLVTFGLFLTVVHPHTSTATHIPNRTPLLNLLNPHHSK